MEETLPPDQAAVYGQRADLASELYQTGHYEEARAMEAAVLGTIPDAPSARAARPTLTADLGAYTFATGKLDEGMHLFEQGLDELVAQEGQDHPGVLAYRFARMQLELELERYDDLERHADQLERALRTHSDLAIDLARLQGAIRTRIALARHRPRDAEQLARGALASWTELHGDDS